MEPFETNDSTQEKWIKDQKNLLFWELLKIKSTVDTETYYVFFCVSYIFVTLQIVACLQFVKYFWNGFKTKSNVKPPKKTQLKQNQIVSGTILPKQ